MVEVIIRDKESVINEAIHWLQDRGKVLGRDYQRDNAYSFANEVSFAEEVKKANKEAAGPIPFSGDGDCEDCDGWFPGDRRCECGNRRVAWEMGSSHWYADPHIYPEAY